MIQKTRRNFFSRCIGAFGLMSISPTTLRSSPSRHRLGSFYHVVYFWLKDPNNTTTNEQFLKNLNGFLDQVKVIRTRYVGIPASTNRSVIDSSYTYSLILSFNDKNDQDVYQEHAAHKKFITDSQEMWERVQVYDSIMI